MQQRVVLYALRFVVVCVDNLTTLIKQAKLVKESCCRGVLSKKHGEES